MIICWEGLDSYTCFLSSNHPVTCNSKDYNSPMQDDYNCSRVARDALVLRSDGSINQDTPTSPTLEDTPETVTSQQDRCGIPESTCMWFLVSKNPIPADSQLRWQRELRYLRGFRQGKAIDQGGPFMGNDAH